MLRYRLSGDRLGDYRGRRSGRVAGGHDQLGHGVKRGTGDGSRRPCSSPERPVGHALQMLDRRCLHDWHKTVQGERSETSEQQYCSPRQLGVGSRLDERLHT